MIARFRFIKVNFGKSLGIFLERTGENLEPRTKASSNSILENQRNTSGRLTDYNKSLTTFELFHYKIILYMLSFILRILTRILIKCMSKKKRIHKILFYFIYYHNRVHFVVFNIYLSGCIFLNARSVLQMKYNPNTNYQIFDKYLNLLCFLFYWWDIVQLFYTSLQANETAGKVKKEVTELPKMVKEAKEFLAQKKEGENESV